MTQYRENTIIARGFGAADVTGSISTPIYRSATYVHDSIEHDKDSFYYSRCDIPTRRELEKRVAALEHGADAVAVTSGLAAIDIVLRLFSPGDHIIVSSDLYGGSYRLFHDFYEKYGIEFDYIDTWDLEAVKQTINSKTKAIIIETPSNPMLRVSDIEELSKLAKNQNAYLIVDNTFLSPLLQKPILLGADIVIHSATKYLSGHNDVLAGIIVTATDELREQFAYNVMSVGNPLSADDAWLTIRGLETLSVRLQRQEENARKIVEFLKTIPTVEKVIYPGEESHPDYKIIKKQQSGFGSMISFVIRDETKALDYFKRFKLIYQAGSLGGVQSLISIPNTSLQCPIPKEIRDHNDVTDRLFRLSVGIEDVEDLKADLLNALSGEINE